jgi:hypothetical protein
MPVLFFDCLIFFLYPSQLPMLWAASALLCALVEMEAPQGSPRVPWIAAYYFVFVTLQTWFYMSNQQFYIVFIVSFVAIVLLIATWGFYISVPRPSSVFHSLTASRV